MPRHYGGGRENRAGKNANRFSGKKMSEGSGSVLHRRNGLGRRVYGGRHPTSNIRNGNSKYRVDRAYRPLWRCRWQARSVGRILFFYIPFSFRYTAPARIIRPARLFSFAPPGRTTRRLSNRPFTVNVFGGRAGVRGTARSRARYAQYERYASRCRSRHLHTTKQHFPVVHTSKIVNNTIFVLRTQRRCRQRVRLHDGLPPPALYYTILCAGHTRVSPRYYGAIVVRLRPEHNRPLPRRVFY